MCVIIHNVFYTFVSMPWIIFYRIQKKTKDFFKKMVSVNVVVKIILKVEIPC